LARVKQLLLNSEESIEQILPSTAFATTSQLSNAFRKAFALSPGQFQRRFKQGSS
jgi:transcriptional regulator GlxA family with amidase domain